MKPVFTDVIGNPSLRERLGADVLDGKLSHAYLIEGARGSGKHMLALRIAAALACENRDDAQKPLPCLHCPACRKILSGNSPDVIYVNREDRATLGVEAIRDLRLDVYVAPNDLSVKVYVIEDAHLMTSQAQNAFLLTLEEPPSYVLFLLLCESTAPLLETVRSRAQTLRTEPIEPERIAEHLVRISQDAAALAQADPTEFSELITSADGSIGRALTLLDAQARKPLIQRRRTAREFVALCAARKSSTATVKFITPLMQLKRDELTEQMNAILLCLRDLLLCKQTEDAPLCFFGIREEALDLAYAFTTPTLLNLCDHVCDVIEQLRANANVRLAVISFAAGIGLL